MIFANQPVSSPRAKANWNLVRASFLVMAGWWVFAPAVQGDWLWDDDVLITGNVLRHDPAGLWKIWTQPGILIDYYPVTFSVQWLQWDLWGMRTLGYHITNIFLHILSALLLWRLYSRLGLRLAWLGALIFVVHPVQVESVAWIAELKNALSLPPLLGAMCLWMAYDETGKARHYAAALALFLAAILCKTTVFMFPVILLLYAWWKRGRIGARDWKATGPFFVIALLLGLLSIHLNQPQLQTTDYIPVGGFSSRVACAGISIAFYFVHCLLPITVMPIYPRWNFDPPSLVQFLPWPILGGILYGLWLKRRGWGQHILFGLGFFLVTLGPFAGFIPAPNMSYTSVMDHFLYIPIIGLIGLVIGMLAQIDQKLSFSLHACGIGLVAIVLSLLGWESHVYAGTFVNGEILWTYTLRHNPDCWLAHNNLGLVWFKQGRFLDAATQYRQALEINPNLVRPLVNLGNALCAEGQFQEGIDKYQEVLKLKPGNSDAEYDWANALSREGQFEAAIDHYRAAVRLKPSYVEAHTNLGVALIQIGHVAEGIGEYQEALRLRPYDADAHYNFGILYGQTGEMKKAALEFQAALRTNPGDAGTHFNLAVALTQTGQVQEAMEQYREALRINPGYETARTNLARLEVWLNRSSQGQVQPGY